MILKLTLVLLAAFAGVMKAQNDETSRSWNQPVKPFRVIGNVYYVGASEVTSFLITTPAGHILLDSGFAETVPQIEQNVAALGFRMEEIKMLLCSQAHYDHAGGLARLKQLTSAELIATAADGDLMTRGGKEDFEFGDRLSYEPVKPDRIVIDGESMKLGGVVMTAHLTPGHTKGCTTWTTTVEEGGKRYEVVFLGGMTVPGYKLLGNEKYPQIVDDYRRSFEQLKKLKCDVFLGAHGSYFELQKKLPLVGSERNPFIDPEGFKRRVAQDEGAFNERLQREQAGAPAN